VFDFWEVREIPEGPAGTLETLNAMAELVRGSLLDPITRETGLHLLTMWRPGDARLGVSRITRWVRQHMAYVNEPIETLHGPAWMLATIEAQGRVWGDCDDAAMLTATLGLSCGLAARLVAIRPPNTEDFVHVFSELGTVSDRWFVSDPTSRRPPPRDWERMVVQI